MTFTRKTQHNKYYEEYLIIFCMYLRNQKRVLNISIKDPQTQTFYYYSNTDIVIEMLSDLNNKAENAFVDSKFKNPAKFVVFINASMAEFLPKYDFLEYIIYDKILPDYSVLFENVDKETSKEFITKIADQIEYFVPTVNLSNFPNGENASFASLARRWMGATYSDIVNTETAYKTRRRHPNFTILKYRLANLKKYNTNNIVKRESTYEIVHDCIKLDINSSFWVIPMIYETGIKYLPAGNKYIDLDNEKGYIVKIKFKHKPTVINPNFPDWLVCHDMYLDCYNNDYMTITKPTWECLKFTYGITQDDVIILNDDNYNYIVRTAPFLDEQRELYRRLHERKAIAKQEKNELLKQIIKIIGHCLHGFALGNWFAAEAFYTNAVEDETKELLARQWYKDTWVTIRDAQYRSCDMMLTAYDATMMYEWAKYHELKLISLFDTVYYYDTDCVVVPDTEENREKIKEYNEWIKQLYAQNELNYLDYTHDGHTIGFLELEAEYDAFYYTTGKEYFYVMNDKLYSTTAGYAKNIVAKHIEDDSGLTGLDALEWLVHHPEYETPMFFIQNGTGISFTTFKHHKYEKGLY